MTNEIALVLAILSIATILFVSERFRVDLVALLVLSSLVITGLLTPEQAIAGFSNPAVVTVWAVFILSGGLAQTGIANLIGKQVLRLAGPGEKRLLVVIMLTAGVLSAFMNNIGVAALLLPVVLEIARQTKRPSSKLLMPLVIGALLGGMTTLIGTPPNILVSDALRDAGLTPFSFFDYTAAGLGLLLAGTAFMVFIGRYLLPTRDPVQSLALSVALSVDEKESSREIYALEDRLAILELPSRCLLAGKPLSESRIGQALGLNILAVMRQGRRMIAPQPETVLQGGDRLLVLGRLERLERLSLEPAFVVEQDHVAVENLLSRQFAVAELTVLPESGYIGKTLAQIDARRRLDLNVLAIRRNGRPQWQNLQDLPLAAGDRLLVQGLRANLNAMHRAPEWRVAQLETAESYDLQRHLLTIRIPETSDLVGRSLVESRLGSTYGLIALGRARNGRTDLMPHPDEPLAAGDVLIVQGEPRDLETVRGLQMLTVNRDPDVALEELETGALTLAEVVLSPHTALANKSLKDLQFRERYGLNVLAIWRGGRAYRSGLGELPLRLGDALLLYGPREKIEILGREPDFLVLHEDAPVEMRLRKAPIATLIMVGVVAAVLLGVLPIALAAVIGATLMVLTGCLSMDEAYRHIEWQAVFLIAGMLPLGIAMAETGAARYLAEGMVSAVGGWGPVAVLGGLFILALLATLFMPNPVVAVLMAPVALSSAADLGVSPYPLMMGIAFGASASFVSPVGHPANVLVMGPGGYRFTDYIKVGLPLAVVLLLVVLFVVPLFWPF